MKASNFRVLNAVQLDVGDRRLDLRDSFLLSHFAYDVANATAALRWTFRSNASQGAPAMITPELTLHELASRPARAARPAPKPGASPWPVSNLHVPAPTTSGPEAGESTGAGGELETFSLEFVKVQALTMNTGTRDTPGANSKAFGSKLACDTTRQTLNCIGYLRADRSPPWPIIMDEPPPDDWAWLFEFDSGWSVSIDAQRVRACIGRAAPDTQ